MSQSGTPAGNPGSSGYRESAFGRTLLVARHDHHDAVREALTGRTLHEWASGRPGARPFQGREIAWATELANGTAVVIRHSRHGGALAALTGDLFLAPSRAPHELATSLRLREAGVPTPDVLAYAVYPAMGLFCRADVVTAVVDGVDFPAAWAAAHTPAAREAIIDAVAALLRMMQAAGARHPDLNVKNILISHTGGAPLAWVLDVDRVEFGQAGDAGLARRNAHRLRRSLGKWRARHGLDVSESHWARLVDGAAVVFDGAPGPRVR